MLLARAISREQETGGPPGARRGGFSAAGWPVLRRGAAALRHGRCAEASCWRGGDSRPCSALHAGTLPRADVVRIDWRSVAFAAGVDRRDGGDLERPPGRARDSRGKRGSGESAHGRRPRVRARATALIAAQTAMAVVLLIGAVLLARSYERLAAVDPGFRSDDVLLDEHRVADPGPRRRRVRNRRAFTPAASSSASAGCRPSRPRAASRRCR